MPKSKDSSVQVAIIVAGLLAVVGGAWLFLNSGTDEVIETPQVATTFVAPSAEREGTIGEESMSVDTALQMAEMAFQSGQLAGDEEGTALEFYREVLRQEPDNARAQAGLELIATQLVDEANDMMAKYDYEQVAQRIDALNKIEPGSDAVMALKAQLAQRAAALFARLDTAIAAGELDQADVFVQSLRRIPDADPGRVSAAMVTIAKSRKEREARAAAGLTEPAIVVDTTEPQTMPSVEAAVTPAVESASTEAASPDPSGLSAASVESLAPNSEDNTIVSSETVEVIDPVEQVRSQIATLLEDAAVLIEQNRLVQPEGDNAVELYQQILALETTNADAKRGLRGVVQKLTSNAYDMAEAGDIEGARAALDKAEAVGIATPLVTQARTDVRAKWLEIESSKVFSVSGFEVEKSVPPKYPKRAMSRSIEGWVKVEFTVAEDGKTRDLQVVESSEKLAKQFSNSALNAVKQWRFKPRVLDGEVIAQRSETLVQFKLTD